MCGAQLLISAKLLKVKKLQVIIVKDDLIMRAIYRLPAVEDSKKLQQPTIKIWDHG